MYGFVHFYWTKQDMNMEMGYLLSWHFTKGRDVLGSASFYTHKHYLLLHAGILISILNGFKKKKNSYYFCKQQQQQQPNILT